MAHFIEKVIHNQIYVSQVMYKANRLKTLGD